MRRRIVVTGVGLITALGTSREETWRRMLAGECGIRPLTVFESTGFRSRVAGEVDMARLDIALTPHARRRHSRGTRAVSE